MMAGFFKWICVTAITLGLCWLSWWGWTEIPSYARTLDRQYLGRIGIDDFSYLLSLILIFLVLSMLHPAIQWVWNKLFPEKADAEERSV